MANRKIAECLNIRINVGNYQHIELTKYAEEEIEYSTKEELIAKEDSLRDDLIASLVRSMKAIPEKLGKGVDSAQEVEQLIKKAIPEWLEKGTVPNIANNAAKSVLKIAAEQKDNKDSIAKNLAEITEPDVKQEPTQPINKTKDAEPKTEVDSILNEDLFEEDETPAAKTKVEETKVIAVVEPKTVKDVEVKKVVEPKETKDGKDGLDDFFDGDDDLFS